MKKSDYRLQQLRDRQKWKSKQRVVVTIRIELESNERRIVIGLHEFKKMSRARIERELRQSWRASGKALRDVKLISATVNARLKKRK